MSDDLHTTEHEHPGTGEEMTPVEGHHLTVGVEFDEAQLRAFTEVRDQIEMVVDAFRSAIAALVPAFQAFTVALQKIDSEYGDVLREAAKWEPILTNNGEDATEAIHKPTNRVVPIGEARSAIEAELAKRTGSALLADDCPHDAPCKGRDACCRNQGDKD